MGETETRESGSDGGGQEALDACLVSAQELLDLLKEESLVLKAFDADRLLPLLSAKEYLANDLSRCIQRLGWREGGREKELSPSVAGRSGQLREMLREIERLNMFNRMFIEHSLDHWQKLITTMELPVYGPFSNRSAGSLQGKGFHFRGEA